MGVNSKLSTLKGKKIDVFNKRGEKVASVGMLGYLDFPTYKKLIGIEYANYRRKLYKIRHENDRHVKGSPGYYQINYFGKKYKF